VSTAAVADGVVDMQAHDRTCPRNPLVAELAEAYARTQELEAKVTHLRLAVGAYTSWIDGLAPSLATIQRNLAVDQAYERAYAKRVALRGERGEE